MNKIDTILAAANEAGASDVHVTVGASPKMRVAGALMTIMEDVLTPEDTLEMANSIMNQEQRDYYEQSGEVDLAYEIPNIGRYRVNVYKQKGNAAIAFRLIDTQVPSASRLGIPESIMNLYNKKRGLILVTGPTGSGKSTTLAALVDKINKNREAHIITLEEPIEYIHTHDKSIVNQREIGFDSTSYANALRAALREDPDVILVGEMRDLETISVAITAAETGHLVLSTLHTAGATNTVDRIIDAFPAHQQQQIRVQLAAVLEAIVWQQLLPSTDGKKRVAAFEVVHANHAVRSNIREGKTHLLMNTIQTSARDGMITMDDALLDLYYKCMISRETVLQFAQDPKSLENRLLSGMF